MIRSMTGFGKGEADSTTPECHITIELVSVNRKQLEIRWSLPREFAAFEVPLRAECAKVLSRGSVNARLNADFHGEAAAQANINQALLEKLIEAVMAANSKFDISIEPDLTNLMRVPGVVESSLPDIDSDSLRDAVMQALAAALANLVNMREQEGAALKRDLEARLETLKTLLAKIKPLAEKIPEMLKEKLLEKIAAADLAVDVNDERLLKEALFYADKSDITEEITRLESHFAQFTSFTASSEAVGRSLDFLMQEMFREITTLGNKANTPEITPVVVAFKSELEKIREQVQNIE